MDANSFLAWVEANASTLLADPDVEACDSVYASLHDTLGISGYDARNSTFSRSRWVAEAARLFGRFEGGRFVPTPALTASQAATLRAVAACVFYGADIPDALVSRIMKQGSRLAAAMAKRSERDPNAVWIGRGPAPAGMGLPVAVVQPIFGEGACLYRALAVGILYAATGSNFGTGRSFSAATLRGDPLGPFREQFDAATPEETAVNVLTLWIKFYVYVLVATDIADVTFAGGIRGTPGVVPITDPSIYLDVAAIAPLVTGLTGTVHVPSLRAVLDVVLHFFLLQCDQTEEYATWKEAHAATRAILAVPWFVPQFNAAPDMPDKTFTTYDPLLRTWSIDVPLASVVYAAVDTQGLGDAALWAQFVSQTRRYGSCGGPSEATVFSSLLRDAQLPCNTVIVFRQNGPDTAVPYVAYPVRVDLTDQVRLLYHPGHYELLLSAIPVPVPEVQQRMYAYAGALVLRRPNTTYAICDGTPCLRCDSAATEDPVFQAGLR